MTIWKSNRATQEAAQNQTTAEHTILCDNLCECAWMLLVSERVCPQMFKEMAVLHVNEAFQLSIRSALHGPNSSCIDHLLIISISK